MPIRRPKQLDEWQITATKSNAQVTAHGIPTDSSNDKQNTGYLGATKNEKTVSCQAELGVPVICSDQRKSNGWTGMTLGNQTASDGQGSRQNQLRLTLSLKGFQGWGKAEGFQLG